MAKLMPLLARSRYTDEEWALSRAGRCDWPTAYYPKPQLCGRPSAPKSFYRWCAEHDEVARRENPRVYGE